MRASVIIVACSFFLTCPALAVPNIAAGPTPVVAQAVSADAQQKKASTASAATNFSSTTTTQANIGPDWYLAGIAMGLAAAALFLLGLYTDILRDSGPIDFGGAKPSTGQYRRPYSLAQSQMAWWFFIILASFGYIASVKHVVNGVITKEGLILMGIGTGTAIGAAIVEQTKKSGSDAIANYSSALGTIAALPPSSLIPQNLILTVSAIAEQLSTEEQFEAVLEQLKAIPAGTGPSTFLTNLRDQLAKKLGSEGFFKDILTDVDGIALHRFQAAVWTVVLGVIFVTVAITQLKMYEFDNLLLGLLGISGATYLGFKIPEQPS